ncbi:MAG TPA: phosphodiester glycosidase family protein, partial [Clostridia bacterium]
MATKSTTAATVAAATASPSSGVSGTVKATTQNTPVITSTSYKDANIQIKIETVRKYDTTLYVADIQV